jgi:hypothetical protein
MDYTKAGFIVAAVAVASALIAAHFMPNQTKRSVPWIASVCALALVAYFVLPASVAGDETSGSRAPTPTTNEAQPPQSQTPSQPPQSQTDMACPEQTQPRDTDWGPKDTASESLFEGVTPSFNNAVDVYSWVDLRTQVISARDAAEEDSPNPNPEYKPKISAEEGKVYRIRVLAANTASRESGAEIVGARASVSLPTCPSKSVQVVGTLSATNAVPQQVWSTVQFSSDRPFRLVPDSRQAKVCLRGACGDGTGLVDFSPSPSIFAPAGTPLGADGYSGTFPGATSVAVFLYVRPVFD